MALSTTGRNLAAGGVAGGVTYLSLHTTDPATAGGSELAGGVPAYARKAVTWAAAANGTAAIAAGVTFDVPTGVTITHVGMWTAAAAGTFQGGAALSTAETYGAQGTFNLTTLTVTF